MEEEERKQQNMRNRMLPAARGYHEGFAQKPGPPRQTSALEQLEQSTSSMMDDPQQGFQVGA